MIISNIIERLYVEAGNSERIWVTANCGDIQIGVGEKVYRVEYEELVEIIEVEVDDTPVPTVNDPYHPDRGQCFFCHADTRWGIRPHEGDCGWVFSSVPYIPRTTKAT